MPQLQDTHEVPYQIKMMYQKVIAIALLVGYCGGGAAMYLDRASFFGIGLTPLILVIIFSHMSAKSCKGGSQPWRLSCNRRHAAKRRQRNHIFHAIKRASPPGLRVPGALFCNQCTTRDVYSPKPRLLSCFWISKPSRSRRMHSCVRNAAYRSRLLFLTSLSVREVWRFPWRGRTRKRCSGRSQETHRVARDRHDLPASVPVR